MIIGHTLHTGTVSLKPAILLYILIPLGIIRLLLLTGSIVCSLYGLGLVLLSRLIHQLSYLLHSGLEYLEYAAMSFTVTIIMILALRVLTKVFHKALGTNDFFPIEAVIDEDDISQ